MNQNLFSFTESVSFHLSPFVLWGVFGVFLTLYLIVSGVLFYHWRAFGMKTKSIVLAESMYILVSLILITIAIFSILSFSHA